MVNVQEHNLEAKILEDKIKDFLKNNKDGESSPGRKMVESMNPLYYKDHQAKMYQPYTNFGMFRSERLGKYQRKLPLTKEDGEIISYIEDKLPDWNFLQARVPVDKPSHQYSDQYPELVAVFQHKTKDKDRYEEYVHHPGIFFQGDFNRIIAKDDLEKGLAQFMKDGYEISHLEAYPHIDYGMSIHKIDSSIMFLKMAMIGPKVVANMKRLRNKDPVNA